VPIFLTKQKLLSYLLGEIYEASYKPEHWPEVLKLIRRLTRSKGAVLIYGDNDLGPTLAHGVGWDGHLLNEYGTKWGAHDPMQKLIRRVPLGTAAACHQLVPDRKEYESLSPEYSKWFEENGGYYSGGAVLFADETRVAFIAIQRSHIQGKWSDRRIKLLTEIVPHLQRALTIHKEFTRLRAREAALRAGLDKLVMGVVLFDQLGEVIYVNPMGQSILKHHPAINLQGHIISAARPEERRQLKDNIMKAARLDPDDVENTGIAMGLHDKPGSLPLPVMVMPIRSGEVFADIDSHHAHAAMFLSDPDRSQPLSPEALTAAYQLTPAEARVAVGIANGMGLDEIAEAHDTSVNTVRSQLKAIFRKTRTNRQSELVKLLLTSPFNLRTK